MLATDGATGPAGRQEALIMKTSIDHNVHEVVHFNAVANATPAAMAEAAQGMSGWLQSLPGFVQRRLSVSADGRFTDVVEWRDMASAREAAALFPTVPQALAFMALIDMASINMSHGEILAAM
jgi:hypothetical protein